MLLILAKKLNLMLLTLAKKPSNFLLTLAKKNPTLVIHCRMLLTLEKKIFKPNVAHAHW